MELTKTLFEVKDGVALITMNFAPSLNALDIPMTTELLYHLEQCDKDPAVKVVVLAGLPKAFSAGGDIGFMYKQVQAGEDLGGDSELSIMVGKLPLTIKKMKKLVITCVSGSAAGAGCNLALAGDFVFASDRAKFIQAFAGVGFVPDTGGMYLLSRIVGSQRALEMCVTGRAVPAEEAKELGMVYATCPAEELAAETMAFAQKLARGPLLTYESIKKQNFAANFEDFAHYLTEVELKTIGVCGASQDFREGLTAFVEKRPPNFQGK